MNTAGSIDHFLGGRLRIRQPARGHRSGSDAVLLAAAVPARAGERVVDLGTGVGVALLCLLARVEGTTGLGIDIDEAALGRARENAAENGFGARVSFVAADLRHRIGGARPGSFDHALANPPYFTEEAGPAAPEPDRAAARTQETGALAHWIKRAADLLRHGGHLTLIQRVERLEETLSACAGRFGGIEIHPLWSTEESPAKRFILRARKGSRAPLALMPGIVLQRDGVYTPAAEAALRGGGALFSPAGSDPPP